MTAGVRLAADPGEGVPVVAPWRNLIAEDVYFPLVGSEGAAGGRREDAHAHVARFGARPSARGADRDRLVADLEEIALTGRGGGHFPAVVKWRAAIGAGGGGIVVANGAEGEPASAKDAALLQRRPHLVLDGLMSAAEATDAREVVVWLHDDALATRSSVVRALEERRSAGMREPLTRIVTSPRHYLSGEATGIVRALSGGPALPRVERVPAAVAGVGGLPTLVHNVETLARAGVVSRSLASAYQDGMLVTVIAGGTRVVSEVHPATEVRDLLDQDHPPQAVLLGGYGGTWAPWSVAATIPLHEPSARRAGLSLGAGVVAALPHEACGIAETAAMLRYLAASSARQCGPCVNGLPALAALATDLAAGTGGRSSLRRLRALSGEIEGRGACRHPDGAIRLLASALRTFAADAERHAKGRPCAGALRRTVLPVPEVDRRG